MFPAGLTCLDFRLMIKLARTHIAKQRSARVLLLKAADLSQRATVAVELIMADGARDRGRMEVRRCRC